MAAIYLVEGPVGSGKSTYALQLGSRYAATKLDLDAWMVTLFRDDRPVVDFMDWYIERKRRCLAQIWQVTCELIDSGVNVILELGLVGQADRADFYQQVDDAGYELHVYVLDVPIEVRRQRVRDRNLMRSGTFKMEVSDEIFEVANAAWQPPDENECQERQISWV